MRDLKRSFKKSNNWSPGPDQIHYEILRHPPNETLHILLNIINETWKSNTFPESWREALIISIPKPGKDHFNPLNYRPIALTSCICKTVERMVNECLRYDKKFMMRDLKRSFKKSNNWSPGPDQIHYEILRHLPIETLHILLDIINETWKSDTFPESWRETLIISIPKPGKDHFNPLNYRPIALTSCICKTVERMVNERLVWYLEKNGLLAKQQCGCRSNRSTVDHLVHLETFIRDAFIQNQHLVAVFFDLQKAYDTTWKYGILQDLHNMGLRGKLQHTINRLEEWTLTNGFTISKNKTVAMHFCPDKKCMDPVLKLDNDPIQFVKEAKFLGFIWDTKLTFEPHINYLKTQCQKSLNILKVLSRTEWGADQTTLLKLYRSLVRSKLDYGSIVYGSASKTALAKLDPVHNQGICLSLGAFRSSPVESLYVEDHEPPLEIRREKLALQYILKLKANPGNPAYDVVFNPKYQILYADKESATDSFGIHCKELLKKAKIDVGEIAINSIPDVPILGFWTSYCWFYFIRIWQVIYFYCF